MKPKDKLQSSLDREIERLAEVKKASDLIPINLISQMFPQGDWFNNWYSITLNMPMSFQLIHEFKEAMKMQFPEFEISYERQIVWDDQKKAGYFLTYKKKIDKRDTIQFDVHFRSENEGSTCILNPIGKEMKEVVKYEVVCSEQAAQEFGMK